MLPKGYLGKFMRKEPVFCNAVCKAAEMRLLSAEALVRLSAAKLDEAIKMLHDYGYNEGVIDDFDIDHFISKEVNSLIGFIAEYSPSDEVEDFLCAPFLYNNIKAEYKRKRGGTKSRLYNIKELGVYSGDYFGLDDDTVGVLNMLDQSNPNSQTIDLLLTKAMYAYRLKKAKKSGSSLLVRYAKAEIDTVNIITMQRANNLKIGDNQKEMLFLPGGNVNYIVTDKDGLPKEYEEFKLNDLVKLETQADNYLLGIADSKSGEMDSVGPLLSYVQRKMNELKTVKMILVCIKSNARNEIPNRIRGVL